MMMIVSQYIQPRTHSDRLVLGPSRKQLAVRTKAYAPNVQIVRIVRSFINQDAVRQRLSAVLHRPDTDIKKGANQVLAPVFVS